MYPGTCCMWIILIVLFEVSPSVSIETSEMSFEETVKYLSRPIEVVDKIAHHDKNSSRASPIVRVCQAFIDEFASHSSLFTKCLIENARPFRFCETCVVPFKKASTVFHDLTTDVDCNKEILTSDRVQLVRLVFQNIESVWLESNCESCFDSVTEDERSGDVTAVVTNATQHFLDLFKEMTSCLNSTLEEQSRPNGESPGLLKQELLPFTITKQDTTLDQTFNVKVSNNKDEQHSISQEDFHPWIQKNDSICVICKVNYTSLNSHYKTIVEYNASVCMDIVDMMNYTRLMWSKTYNCSHRRGDMAPILVIATVISALPIVFYVTNRITGQRQGRTILKQKRMKKTKTSSYGSMSESQHILVNSSNS